MACGNPSMCLFLSFDLMMLAKATTCLEVNPSSSKVPPSVCVLWLCRRVLVGHACSAPKREYPASFFATSSMLCHHHSSFPLSIPQGMQHPSLILALEHSLTPTRWSCRLRAAPRPSRSAAPPFTHPQHHARTNTHDSLAEGVLHQISSHIIKVRSSGYSAPFSRTYCHSWKLNKCSNSTPLHNLTCDQDASITLAFNCLLASLHHLHTASPMPGSWSKQTENQANSFDPHQQNIMALPPNPNSSASERQPNMSNNRQATATGTTQASREVAGLSVAVPPRSGLPALPYNAAIPANTDGTAVNQTAPSGEQGKKRAASRSTTRHHRR